MEYCSPLWDGAGHFVLGRLDRLQNRAIRLINDRRVTDDIPSLQIRRNVVLYVSCTDIFMVGAQGSTHVSLVD